MLTAKHKRYLRTHAPATRGLVIRQHEVIHSLNDVSAAQFEEGPTLGKSQLIVMGGVLIKWPQRDLGGARQVEEVTEKLVNHCQSGFAGEETVP